MKRILGVCMIILAGWQMRAQQNIHETVYSHLSAQDLIVGETLYFSNYVFSSQTGRLSDLSRLLYVELLDQSGQSVDQVKIPLDQGTGEGRIYLPGDLSTGNYHFVAYTRWMKNFSEFYHQPITVVNPYQAPEKIPVEKQRRSVQFRVEGGTFLANAKNKIVLRVSDQYNRGVTATGKIISKSDDFTLAIETDEFGFFSATLAPEVEEAYQLILETEAGFEFYDLPLAEAGQHNQLKVMSTQDLYIVKLTSFDPELYSQGELGVFENRRLVLSKPAALNTSTSLEKKNLPPGLLRLEFKTGTGRTQERLIWNGTLNTLKSYQRLEGKGTLEKVNYSCVVPDSALLSVSIEKVEDSSSLLSLTSYELLESKLKLKLPENYYTSLSEERLDDILIFAQWAAPKQMPAEVKWLPEHRQGLVQGRVVDNAGRPAGQVNLGLALPGNYPQMTAGVSDSSGYFVLGYDPFYTGDEPRIAFLNEENELQIQVAPEYYPVYPVFPNPPMEFDSLRVKRLIERSLYNQIENAYHQTESSTETQKVANQFDGVKSYRLADYVRFSTIRDTFIELIPEVGVSKNENDFSFRMRSKDLSSNMLDQLPTLLLLDGAFVTARQAMQLSPYLVDRIDVLNRRYYFGSLVFDGIISIHTLAGDGGNASILGSKLSLANVDVNKSTVISVISNEDNPRFPNYQDLLYWNPAIRHSGGQLDFSFLTSEVPGLFEIRVEGIATNGTPVSKRAYFKVTKR